MEGAGGGRRLPRLINKTFPCESVPCLLQAPRSQQKSETRDSEDDSEGGTDQGRRTGAAAAVLLVEGCVPRALQPQPDHVQVTPVTGGATRQSRQRVTSVTAEPDAGPVGSVAGGRGAPSRRRLA